MALVVAGPSVHAIELLSNLFWVLLLVAATFLTGRRVGGERVGLLAAFLVLTMLLVAGAARDYRVDLPLTATVTLAMWQLLRPECFQTVDESILFALPVRPVVLGMSEDERSIDSDFVITKTGDPGTFFDPAVYAASARYFGALVSEGVYKVIGRFPLPDGSVARLYQRG